MTRNPNRPVAYCGLEEDVPLHQAAQECFSAGILCEDCDWLQHRYPQGCDGNCAECDQEAEGNCVPAKPAE